MDKNELLKMIANFTDNKQSAEKLVSQLDDNKKNELNSILNDKNKVNEILNSPAAQSIINKLNGKSNG